jgi:hypothetical protein
MMSTLLYRWHPPSQQAKLVALRVGQHVPAFVAGLADVGPAGARREQSVEFRLLVAVGGVDVDVQPKPSTLGFVCPVEDDGGLRTAEASLRRSDLDAAVDAVELDIAEDRAPEPGQQVRIVCVKDEFRYATCHRATLSRGPRPRPTRSRGAGHEIQACRPSSVSSRANASSAAPRRGPSVPSRAGRTGGGGVAR